MRTRWLLLTFTCVISVSNAQTYTVADFVDFTHTPNSHVLNPVQEPFTVSAVQGLIQFENGSIVPKAGVLFEIQGPGADRTIRRATSDPHGRFRIDAVPFGIYKFKTSLDGFESIVGTLILTKGAPKQNKVVLKLQVEG